MRNKERFTFSAALYLGITDSIGRYVSPSWSWKLDTGKQGCLVTFLEMRHY